MIVVVADTTPIRYLAEIDHLDLLPRLFTTIHIPVQVYRELQHASTPPYVYRQLATPPAWLKIASQVHPSDPGLKTLDEGERAAISLGAAIHADLILIDERKGTAAAVKRGFETAGTLGILLYASGLELIDLENAFTRLKATTFRHKKGLLDELLVRHTRKKER